MSFLSQRYTTHAIKYGPTAVNYLAKSLFSNFIKPSVEIFIRINKQETTSYKIDGNNKPFDYKQTDNLIKTIENTLINSTPEGGKLTRSFYTDDGLVTKVLAGPGIEWSDTGE